MKSRADSIIFGLIFIYLTCYFMQLFGFPDLLMLVLGAAACLFLLIRQKKLRVDVGVCLLVITMFSYCIIVFGIRAIAIMMPYIPVLIYVLAHYLSKEAKSVDKTGVELSKAINCLVFGHAVHGILNSYLFFAGYGWEGTRYWMDIWEREIVPGTQLTVYYLPAFALLLPAILYYKKKMARNTAVILLAVFFIYASLATRSRTMLLGLAIVLVIQSVLFALLESGKIKKIMTPKKIIALLGCSVLVGIIFVIALKDLEIIQVFIKNLGKDGGILNNVRFVVQRQALSQVLDYPWGGLQMELDMRYTHNVWLDLANEAGYIPFFGFLAYTLWTLFELIRFVINKEIVVEIKLMLVGIYVAFFIYYTVESALSASIHLMTPWMFVNGLVHGYVSQKE